MWSAAFATFKVLVTEMYSQISNTVRAVTYDQASIFLKQNLLI
jgi:hypothetical protein